MIPVSLSISGFLSYKDPAEIDFISFAPACISGQNGAGKLSILDAMTWALFGRARKHDESIINLESDAAQVTLTEAQLKSLPGDLTSWNRSGFRQRYQTSQAALPGTPFWE